MRSVMWKVLFSYISMKSSAKSSVYPMPCVKFRYFIVPLVVRNMCFSKHYYYCNKFPLHIFTEADKF